MRVWLGAIYVIGAVSGGAIGSGADPTLSRVKSSEGRDYLIEDSDSATTNLCEA